MPARAVGAARRAVDSDDEFRSRVAEVVSADDVGRAGWLWLTRPPGWEAELDDLQREVTDAGEAAADRRAETEARRRLAGAEAATQRAEAAAATASAEAARAVAALAEERRSRRAAAAEVEDLAGRLQQVTSERDRARAERDGALDQGSAARRRVLDLETELDELRRRPPEPPRAPAPPDPAPAAAAAARAATAPAAGALLGAASAAGALSVSLEAAALALGAEPQPTGSGSPPSATARPVAPPSPPASAPPRRVRPPRRVPAPLPPGILDDSVEAADHLVRVPGMALLVDGYNVSQTGWPELAIAEQRRRLVDALTELATRTGVDVSVVFDGADPLWPPAVPAVSRLVRVSFSPAEVEADDVVLARVADLDASRPVLVATSDRRVRDGATALGANVISSPQLLAALRR
jgi:predicted RNA-binding protein with PIN domain